MYIIYTYNRWQYLDLCFLSSQHWSWILCYSTSTCICYSLWLLIRAADIIISPVVPQSKKLKFMCLAPSFPNPLAHSHTQSNFTPFVIRMSMKPGMGVMWPFSWRIHRRKDFWGMGLAPWLECGFGDVQCAKLLAVHSQGQLISLQT